MATQKRQGNASSWLKKALASNDVEQRLSLSLEAWRTEPVTRLRALVLELSRLAAATAPTTPRLEKKAWDALLAGKKASDVPLLAASIAQAPPAEAVRRFKKLSALGADPQLIDATLGWISQAPIQTASAESKSFWKLVFAFLAKCGDLTLPARLPELDPQGSGTTVIFLRGQVSALIAALGPAKEPALSDAASAVLADVESTTQQQRTRQTSAATRGARSEAELLDAVYAAPGDDGPRLVYADFLSERGDPWGEFVVLQIAQARGEGTPANQARADKLLAAHAEARHAGLPVEWKVRFQGALRPPVFRRGFLTSAEIWLPSLRPLSPASLAHGDPRWGTVEHLRLTAFDAGSTAEVIGDPAKRSLRGVFDVGIGSLSQVLPKLPPGVEELGLGFLNDVPDDALRSGARLLAKTTLRAVTVECTANHHAKVLSIALEELGALERISVSCRAWTHPDLWRLSRVGRTLRLELHKRVPPAATAWLHAAVATCAPAVDELVLVSEKPLSPAAQKKALEAAFGPLAARARVATS